jgi:putative pyruvate formate lyase activating enzyme
VVPQILEALPRAVARGVRLPIVYNTSAYDALTSLALMDGVVDIYMPDFKYWSAERSKHYLRAEDYPEAARAAFREMHRQVGDLVVDERGIARRGLLVRHLVMPGALEESREILRWLAEEISPATYVNVMGQYRPDHRAMGYPELARPVTPREVAEARAYASGLGLRLDERLPSPRSLPQAR